MKRKTERREAVTTAAGRSFIISKPLPDERMQESLRTVAIKAREKTRMDSTMNTTMNTKLNETKTPRREMTHRLPGLQAEDQEREAALERLLALLAAGTSEAQAPHAPDSELGGSALLRLARLRAAHAAYSLETIGGMERVGAGAWMRRTSRRTTKN